EVHRLRAQTSAARQHAEPGEATHRDPVLEAMRRLDAEVDVADHEIALIDALDVAGGVEHGPTVVVADRAHREEHLAPTEGREPERNATANPRVAIRLAARERVHEAIPDEE